jgi:molybdopterin molybdotransferase
VLTTAEASAAIASAIRSFGSETVVLGKATGRTLHQPVVAERDQPPFDRVTMDGIAIKFDGLSPANRCFRVQATQHAGDAVTTLASPVNCIEIMTGGVLPLGTDCIIPVERITVSEGFATLEDGYDPAPHQFIHPQGSDHRKDYAVLSPGKRITPMDIAVIASCGLETVLVNRQPGVRVISTGNELVPPGRPIEPHQVRLSNGPAVVAMLAEQGFVDTVHEHLLDDPASMKVRIAALLNESDVLILSGGVSMGKADYVPQILADLGVSTIFHKISQRPGKPMWFGIGTDGQAVFALPGNPVSTLVCCRQYVLPALLKACGRSAARPEFAVLAEEIRFAPALTCFFPVRLESTATGAVSATPVPTNTSGDFAALAGTQGYVELDREVSLFAAGTAVPLHRWNQP